jgi:peptide deformylase
MSSTKTRNDIITLPDERLRQKSARVGFISDEIRQLAEDMIAASLDWEASRDHEACAALAAVQIGVLERVVTVRDDMEARGDSKGSASFSVFINPEIVKLMGEPEEMWEGCLSVDSIYGHVMRYPKVKIKALNLDGKEVRLTATGFLAQVFQHEIDHTNGIVFVDRVEDASKLRKIGDDGTFVKIP